MRIALVTETFFPSSSSRHGVHRAETTVKALADRLVDTGHEVSVVAPGPGLASYRGSPVTRVRTHERPGRQVRGALEAFEPDLVHVCTPGTIGQRALKHARRLGVRTLVTEQSALLDVTADHWRRQVGDRADEVVVTSRWMVERLAEFGTTAARWEPGVDGAAFTPELRDPWLHARWSRARSRRGHLVPVGYVGDLRKRDGVRRLAALADLPGIRPVVIGAGPQRDWLAARLPDAVLSGPLGTGDLAVALASLDVLVHPGEHETCGHVLREAAASGLPVVAVRSGGAPDVVRHLETGVLHEPADPRGLVEAVAAVAADRHRGLLGERARDLVTRRTWADAVDELVGRHYPPEGPVRTSRAA
jgi:phosphatidylinositol alpha 1,6-mannosyltransferase